MFPEILFFNSLTWSYAVLLLAHGVEGQVVDVPVVLVPGLEEADHAVEEEQEEENQDERLLSTHCHLCVNFKEMKYARTTSSLHPLDFVFVFVFVFASHIHR